MLRALVTTVIGSCRADAVVAQVGTEGEGAATSVVVVPPLRPTTLPGTTMPAAGAAIECFSSGRLVSL